MMVMWILKEKTRRGGKVKEEEEKEEEEEEEEEEVATGSLLDVHKSYIGLEGDIGRGE